MSIRDFTLYTKETESGIALERARLCTVCWTIHVHDECPNCGARQWHMLVEVLRSVATGIEQRDNGSEGENQAHLRLVNG